MKAMTEKSAGYSLAELLIAMAVAGLVMTGMYSVFIAQQKAHTSNMRTTEMQQNLRAAMALMEEEIRMAGYSPLGTAPAGIQVARRGLLRITMDYNDDGDCSDSNEDVTFGFSAANDAAWDGVADAGAASLGRSTGGTGGPFQPLADDIHAVQFAYAYDSNQDGTLDSSGGNVIWAYDSNGDGTLDINFDTGVALGSTVLINRIRAVKIYMLARSRTTIQGYNDGRTYSMGAAGFAPNPPNDAYMRRTLTTTVKCRNLGT